METTLPLIYQRHLEERRAIRDTASNSEWSVLIACQKQERLEYRESRRASALIQYRKEHPTESYVNDFLDYLPVAILKVLVGMVVGLSLIILVFSLVG